MSGWSFGFGQSLPASLEKPAAEVQQSAQSAHPSLGFINTSHKEMKERKQKLSENLMNDSVANGEDGEMKGLVFCTKDNLLNSIAYINQELELLGIPCLKFEGGKCTADMYFYINRLHDLLVLYHKTTAVKEDLETKNHRLSCETNHHQSICARLRREQGQLEREIAQEMERSRQINHKYKQLSVKLKAEKEEVKRLLAVMQSRDIQHRHDNKKKEREVIGLKERLHQLLADKVPDRKVGMDLMNVVSTGENRRATWKMKQGKLEEEMYQLVIANYEERHNELMLENADLRDCLWSLQRQLSGLLKNTGKMASKRAIEMYDMDSHSTSICSEDGTEDQSLHSRLSITDLSQGYIQMPFDIVRKEIERIFQATCDQISDGMRQSLEQSKDKTKHDQPSTGVSNSMGSNSSERGSKQKRISFDGSEVERLKKQISNYKDIIQQQEELIQQSLHTQSQSVETTFLHESQLLKEKENLSEQKKLFFEEKSAFENERRAFTDAALRLGKERQALQEERSSFLKQQLQNSTPVKEDRDFKSKDIPHPARLLPATPVFSPAKVLSRTNTYDKSSKLQEQNPKLSLSDNTNNQTNAINTGPPKKTEGTRTLNTAEQMLHESPVVHYTPHVTTASASLTAPTTLAATATTVSDSSISANSGTLNAAASLESIKAALVRIRKSASQQEP